jgi:hypothetical protein
VSVSSILLFVGGTTLVAALVTLCAFQINAAKLERRINRRSRTLEGPVPGHRSLSSIGLNADAVRRNPSSFGLQGPKSPGAVGLRKDGSQEPRPSPSPVKEARLNSLQTIQARSAALHGDGQQAKPANPKPLTLAQSQVAQRQSKRDGSDQEPEQGLAERQPKRGTEKAGNTDSIPLSSASAVEPGAQTVAPKTPASKRAKRAGVQAERIESSHPSSDQALSDAAGSESAGPLQSSGIGGPLSQEDGLPDIFAGLNEADAGTLGLIDDLSDIDSGGLPGAARKIPQKSKR